MTFNVLPRVIAKILGRCAIKLTQYSEVLHKYSYTSEYQWFTVDNGSLSGCKFYDDINSSPAIQIRRGKYEQFLFDAAAGLHIDWTGKTIWDIGAHFGYHTFKFASLVGDAGKVVAFEPNPYNLDRIKMHLYQNTDLAERISLHHIALSDVEDIQQFRYSDKMHESDLGYLAANGIPSERIPAKVYERFHESAISVRTIDGFLAENPNMAPNIIKIDVEGGEFSLLNGALQTIHRYEPILFLEIHNIQNMFMVQQTLSIYGYDSRLIDDPLHPSSSRAFLIAKG